MITTERLCNLAVSDDESYVANEIVVHNCKSYLKPRFVGVKKNPPIDKNGLNGKINKTNKKDITLKIQMEEV